MIFEHHSDFEGEWRWPNFDPGEPNICCACCGEYYHDPRSLDLLQAARTLVGKPFTINSGHRCRSHNRAVGGAIASQHLKVAWDISLHNQDPGDLLEGCQKAGFTTFGFYGTFLHVDRRPGRRWFTKAGRRTWNFLLT